MGRNAFRTTFTGGVCDLAPELLDETELTDCRNVYPVAGALEPVPRWRELTDQLPITEDRKLLSAVARPDGSTVLLYGSLDDGYTYQVLNPPTAVGGGYTLTARPPIDGWRRPVRERDALPGSGTLNAVGRMFGLSNQVITGYNQGSTTGTGFADVPDTGTLEATSAPDLRIVTLAGLSGGVWSAHIRNRAVLIVDELDSPGLFSLARNPATSVTIDGVTYQLESEDRAGGPGRGFLYVLAGTDASIFQSGRTYQVQVTFQDSTTIYPAEVRARPVAKEVHGAWTPRGTIFVNENKDDWPVVVAPPPPAPDDMEARDTFFNGAEVAPLERLDVRERGYDQSRIGVYNSRDRLFQTEAESNEDADYVVGNTPPEFTTNLVRWIAISCSVTFNKIRLKLSGDNRGVVGLIVTSRGSGYTSAPTVSLSGGGGTGAAVTARLLNGAVTALTVTSRGSGYTSAPTVSFSGGGGSGAAATASVGMTEATGRLYFLNEDAVLGSPVDLVRGPLVRGTSTAVRDATDNTLTFEVDWDSNTLGKTSTAAFKDEVDDPIPNATAGVGWIRAVVELEGDLTGLRLGERDREFDRDSVQLSHTQYLRVVCSNIAPHLVSYYRNRVVLAFEDTIQFSPYNQIARWEPAQEYFRQGGDRVTGLLAHDNFLAVFQRGAIYAVTGNSDENLGVETLANFSGTTTPASLATDAGFVFYSDVANRLSMLIRATDVRQVTRHVQARVDRIVGENGTLAAMVRADDSFLVLAHNGPTTGDGRSAFIINPDTLRQDQRTSQWRVSLFPIDLPDPLSEPVSLSWQTRERVPVVVVGRYIYSLDHPTEKMSNSWMRVPLYVGGDASAADVKRVTIKVSVDCDDPLTLRYYAAGAGYPPPPAGPVEVTFTAADVFRLRGVVMLTVPVCRDVVEIEVRCGRRVVKSLAMEYHVRESGIPATTARRGGN